VGRFEQDHFIGEPVVEPAQRFGRKPLGLNSRRLEISPEIGIIEVALFDMEDRASPEFALNEPGDAGDRSLALFRPTGGGREKGQDDDNRPRQTPPRGPLPSVDPVLSVHLF
jgi:hypothetical protein